ncbi:hypothetical protein ACH5Y9_14710 [Methylomonas sp. BW4-1]|uniref:hypothetical protein n=1 Tax=Methylomonas sp. BW4-1 TaxID=3376685 RepID=UPI004041744D
MISYYGRPLRSVCPFCGATFMRFPSGFQRFFQRFSEKKISFATFNRIAALSSCFGIIWFCATLGFLPNEITPFAIFGFIIFGAFTLAELIYQSIELMAAKLSHDSRYYWVALVLLAVFTANLRTDFTNYLVIFALVMTVRWILAGFAAASNAQN